MEGNLHALNKEDLINIIKQKTASNHTLMNERKWIEEDNHIHRVQAVELKEKLLKWQTYANEKDQQNRETQNECLKLRDDDKKWRVGFSRVQECMRTRNAEFKRLKVICTELVKQRNAIKQERDLAITVGKNMREQRDYYKKNNLELLYYIICHPPSNAVADIRQIDEEPLSNALVPLFQNQSSTAPPDVRTLFSSSGRISVTVNYPGGLHCPTQPFAWINYMEIPRITESRRPSEICTWRMTTNYRPNTLVSGADLPLEMLEEGRNTTSTSLHGLLSVSSEDDTNSSNRINVSSLHLSTWQSAPNHRVEALQIGSSLLVARPEEGKHIASSAVEHPKYTSDTDLSDSGHVTTETKVKVRQDTSLIIYRSQYSCSCMCLNYQVAELGELPWGPGFLLACGNKIKPGPNVRRV